MNRFELKRQLSVAKAKGQRIIDAAKAEGRSLTDDEKIDLQSWTDQANEIKSQLGDGGHPAKGPPPHLSSEGSRAQTTERHYPTVNVDPGNEGQTQHGFNDGRGVQGELSRQEALSLQGFTFGHFVRQAVRNKLTGLNTEINDEGYREMNAWSSGNSNFHIPGKVIRHAEILRQTPELRDLTAGVDTQGGHTVSTDVLSIVPALREMYALSKLGSTMLTGVRNNLLIPVQSGKTSPQAKTETGSADESNITFSSIELKPKRVTTFVDVSRLLIYQNPSIEEMVISDLIAEVNLKNQAQAINGSGTNEATGILQTTGIGAVQFGPDANTGGAPTRAKFLELKKELAKDNAFQGRIGLLVNGETSVTAEGVLIDAGSGRFLFQSRPLRAGMEITSDEGLIAGIPTVVSNAMPADGDKGTYTDSDLSSVILANWKDHITAQFGGLDLIIDPYTRLKENLNVIVCHMYFDSSLRHVESAAAATDVLAA